METRGHFSPFLAARAIATVALALSVVAATAIASGAWKGVRGKPAQRHLRVTGSAKKRIVSDRIEWSATIEAHAVDSASGYKHVRLDAEKAIAFLKKQGIPDGEIFPQAANSKPHTETQYTGTGEQRVEKSVSDGFDTTQQITVRSADVARVERASREITALLEQGMSIDSGAPSYYYTGLGMLKLEMLASAGRDARTRAENILGSTGGAKVGKLLSADMGIINVNSADSTETSEQGNNDTTSLEKDIITIVHADYELD
ncbi:MAG: SIMPL domain-containing protein [Polyangia bacterium]